MDQPVNDKHLTYFGANYSKYRAMGFFLTGSYIYRDRYSLMLGAKYRSSSARRPGGVVSTVSAFWRLSEGLLTNVDGSMTFRWGKRTHPPRITCL
jgi:hypothetical protein